MVNLNDITTYYSSQPKVKKFLREGRGQGAGKDYVPWIKTHEFSSKGRATRIFGVKTNRIHHLQSDNQYRAFLIFEFCKMLSDIRESFPLLDAYEVIDEKDDLRFDKFRDKDSGDLFVITTNFLLTVVDSDGSEKYVARSVKNTSELKRKTTWEKLEIERRYWKQRQIDWKVITEKELPRQLAKNIEWVRETLLSDSEENIDKESCSLILLRYLLENAEIPLNEVIKTFERQEGLKKGTGLFLFRYLVAKREVEINMNCPINLSSNVLDLILTLR